MTDILDTEPKEADTDVYMVQVTAAGLSRNKTIHIIDAYSDPHRLRDAVNTFGEYFHEMVNITSNEAKELRTVLDNLP